MGQGSSCPDMRRGVIDDSTLLGSLFQCSNTILYLHYELAGVTMRRISFHLSTSTSAHGDIGAKNPHYQNFQDIFYCFTTPCSRRILADKFREGPWPTYSRFPLHEQKLENLVKQRERTARKGPGHPCACSGSHFSIVRTDCSMTHEDTLAKDQVLRPRSLHPKGCFMVTILLMIGSIAIHLPCGFQGNLLPVIYRQQSRQEKERAAHSRRVKEHAGSKA
ncbi:uncharacterized protein EI90DRAFT_2604475 [Cantharellus anzutake]|uniref:uncharacterized protein n=1 Tax=Cantharellus anzutake TaxID=1750568 RepID=UPI001902E2A3|nr:uncharacterized protein EI90DRAFT_2604475 [Cantharellus anzutake]KAF8320579.1 hypothetical protein EI90DRAFT_2604475 [Cantharellus anzutake]